MEPNEVEDLANENRSQIIALKVSLTATMNLVKQALMKQGMSEKEFEDVAEKAFNEAQEAFDRES